MSGEREHRIRSYPTTWFHRWSSGARPRKRQGEGEALPEESRPRAGARWRSFAACRVRTCPCVGSLTLHFPGCPTMLLPQLHRFAALATRAGGRGSLSVVASCAFIIGSRLVVF